MNASSTNQTRNWPPERKFTPLDWQLDAMSAWEQAGRMGIVEAVTGSGKTYLGLEAMHRLLSTERRLSVLIVVPSIPIMEQWKKRAGESFKNGKVGLLGGGQKDNFSTPGRMAIVGVINSVVRQLPSLFEHTNSASDFRTLLIADECHHYIEAPVWKTLTRKWNFSYRLGLTATLGDDHYEIGGLGRVVYEYKFKDAYADNLVPPFDLVQALVDLTYSEREQYGDLTEKIGKQLILVFEKYQDELRDTWDEQNFKKLRKIMMSGSTNPEHWDPDIKRLFGLIFRRVEIVYCSQRKMELAELLVRELVLRGKKVLVFFERIQSAEDVGEDLAKTAAKNLQDSLRNRRCSVGVPTLIYNSSMTKSKRAEVLASFAQSGPAAMLACKALDEGLDLPDVDAAVLVSSTRSTRQRIQRIGRTLRRGGEDKKAMVVSLHVGQTGDTDVLAGDKEIFGDVAEITTCRGKDALSVIQNLQNT